MNTFDVFISYAHVDRAFALDLQRRLEVEALAVWVDDEQMVAGDKVRTSLVQGLEKSRNVVFVITEAWLAGDWTNWEGEVADHIAKESGLQGNRRLIPILRTPRDPRKLPSFLSQIKSVDWPEDDPDPEARFWHVLQGLGGKAAGPRDLWSERSRTLSGSLRTSRTDEEADSSTARRAKLGLAPAPLNCNRTDQWAEIKRRSAQQGTEALFVQGARGEGHETFLARVELLLPTTPSRRVLPVFWDQWKDRIPETPEGFLKSLALAVGLAAGCPIEQLEDTLRRQLARDNLWFVHRPVLARRLKKREDLFVQYYTEILPDLIARVLPDPLPDAGSGGIKVVQGIAWCSVPKTRAGFAWLAARLGFKEAKLLQKVHFQEALQRLEIKQALKRVQRKAHKRLPIFLLQELEKFEPDHVKKLCPELEVDPAEEEGFLEDVLYGAPNSAEILNRISLYQLDKVSKYQSDRSRDERDPAISR